jgi:hypothetical protein
VATQVLIENQNIIFRAAWQCTDGTLICDGNFAPGLVLPPPTLEMAIVRVDNALDQIQRVP